MSPSVETFQEQSLKITLKAGLLGWLAAALTMMIIFAFDSTMWTTHTLVRLESAGRVVGAFAGLTLVPTLLSAILIGRFLVATSLSCIRFLKFTEKADSSRPLAPTRNFLIFRGILSAFLTVVLSSFIYVLGAWVLGHLNSGWKLSELKDLAGIFYMTLLIGGYSVVLGSWAIVVIGIWHGIKIHNLIHKIRV